METLKGSKLLVVGGTGFIGHHLLKASLGEGCEVTSVSMNKPSDNRFVNGVRYLNFDISDRKLVKLHINEEFQYVVNLGGYINHISFKDGGRSLIEAHFTSLQNLVESIPSSKLKRFVQIGSSDEYGNGIAPQHEKLLEKPISPYSLAKVASTHFLQMLHRTENYPAVILRLFLTYGPGQDSTRFLPQIICGCLDDTIFPTSSGEQLRDFCFVEDTVNAIIQALVKPEAVGEVFNVASGIPVSIRTMIDKVCDIVGSGKPQYGVVPYRTGENMELYASIVKAKNLLAWEAKTDIDVGLKKTVDWFANNK